MSKLSNNFNMTSILNFQSSSFLNTQKTINNLWEKIYKILIFQGFEPFFMEKFFSTFQPKLKNYDAYCEILEHKMKNLTKNKSVERSEPESVFKYSKWFKIMPTNGAPKISYFKFLNKNEANVKEIIYFYKTFRPTFINSQLTVEQKRLWYQLPQCGGDLLLPTFQCKNVVSNICRIAGKNWTILNSSDKIAIWSLCTGFYDNIKLGEVSSSVFNNTSLGQFLKEEVRAERILNMSGTLNMNIITAKYFCIVENKVDSEGHAYVKNRYVSDCTATNKYLSPPAADLHYTFKTADDMFKNFDSFQWLISADRASVLDRSDYYRCIPVIPFNLSFISAEENKIFADLYLKMGQTYASCYAQMSSNCIDRILNNRYDSIKISTLQDDSFVLQRDFFDIDQIVKINQAFGFRINPKKTQDNVIRAAWSGYIFDLQNKSLELQPKRIQKLEEVILGILSSQKVTRRKIASCLGKIFSQRLLMLGLGLNFSAHTAKTRQLLFSNTGIFKDFVINQLKKQWFFNQAEFSDKSDTVKAAYKEFFDSEVYITDREGISKELLMAMELSNVKVPFTNVRRFIFSLNEFPSPSVKADEEANAIICTDSSSVAWGAHLVAYGKNYAIGGKFKEEDLPKSINLKELFALILGMLAAINLDTKLNKSSRWLLLVDNNVSLSLAISKSVHIKSPILAKMAGVISMVQFSSNSNFVFERIKSEENTASDFISRMEEDQDNISGLMGLCISEIASLLD